MKKAAILLALSALTLTVLACKKESAPAIQAIPNAVSHPIETSSKELVVQTTCPIFGNPIDSSLFIDQGDKRIYVCCASCIEQVKNDFAGAEKKLADKGQKPETIK